jgi:YVTN family beta-propeller protein
MDRLRLVAAGLMGGVAVAAWGQDGNLLVISKQAHTLAVVDSVSLKVMGTAPVGEDPHEVIASTDGRTAYVSNYGFGAFYTLTMIDLKTIRPKGVVDLGALRGPHGLVFVGGKPWFTAEAAKAVGRYDPASGKVDFVLGTGQNRTHMIWVSADQQRIVTTNVNSGTVSLMERIALKREVPPQGPGAPPPALPKPGMGPSDDGKDWDETVVKVGNGSEGFDVSPDGREVWVANAQDGTVSVVDFAGKRVVATLQVEAPGANRLKFTPDGRRVLVGTPEGVAVIDAGTREVVKRIALGRGASGIQMEPNGARAFVSCNKDGWVAVLDLKTMTMAGKIDAGGEPDGLAWVGR